MLIFSNNCALLLKVNNLLENMLIFRKLWLFVHVQIFIRVFLLLENCYFDSKYDFIRWYFGKSVIFLVKFTFQVALFLFGKKYHFMQKVLVFDQMSEFLRTVIKSCRAKLWSKVTSVFLNSNFCAKMSILGKKKLNFVRNVDFFKQVCTTTESEHLIGKHAYFQKIVTFCVIVYIHQETVEFW